MKSWFQNILVANSGAEEEPFDFERACQVARGSGAQLTVLDVLSDVPQDFHSWFDQARLTPQEFQQRRVSEQETRLAELAAPARQAGIPVQTRVRIGKPSIEIIREVLQSDHDLVMKAAAPSRGLRSYLFGSVDLQLMRQCPCPVWIDRAPRNRYRKVLAAVDPGPPSLPLPATQAVDDANRALNEKILQLASAVAGWEQSELHVVHAWNVFSEAYLRASMDATEQEVARLVESVEQEHRAQFEQLLEPFHSAERALHPHLLKGSPDEVIPRLATELGVDLIVMGTVCRTGLSGFLIGNTAETILSNVETSVLTVKPDGFVSPVHPND